VAEVDRTKFSQRHHSFMIFVDGVEIPWLYLQIRCQLEAPTTVEVHVEPDDLIERIRPKSYIHIFMSDPYNEDEPANGRPEQEYERNSKFDKHRYYMCFEGQIQGITESESAESRSMVLSCSDLFSVINNTSLDLVQLDNGIHIPMVNGSTFYGSYVDGNTGDDSFLKYVIYAAMGFATTDPASDQATRDDQLLKAADQQYPVLRDGRQGRDKYFYFDAVRLAMKYFIQFNASYRLQTMRSRLFDKMFGITDQTFTRFMERRVAQTLINNGFTNVPYNNLGQLMAYMLGLGLHSYTSMLFPVPNSRSTEGAWNQYLFLPNLYYAIPPSCNWIFPDHIQSLNASRFFLQEPTRIGVNDTMVGGVGLMHLAPQNLTELLTGGTPAVSSKNQSVPSPEMLFAANPVSARPSVTPRGERELDGQPFRLTGGAENPISNPNLLRMLSASEVEKGIVFRISNISVEYFAGVHGTTDASLANAGFSDKKEIQKKLDDNIKEQVREESDYIRYNRTITNYRLSLERLSRDVSLAGPFNPWAVVGFPTIICRADRSYRGLLTGLVHTVGASGEAQTVYSTAYTTLFRPKFGEFSAGLREVKKLSTDSSKAEEELNSLVTSIRSSDSKLTATDPKSLQTELKQSADALSLVEDALGQFDTDIKNWEKRESLVPLVTALTKLEANLPADAKTTIGDLIPETKTAIEALQKAVTSTQPKIKTFRANVIPTDTPEMADWVAEHTGEPRDSKQPVSRDFPLNMKGHLALVDFLFDYKPQPGFAHLFTTADIRTAPGFASPPLGNRRELDQHTFAREFKDTSLDLSYTRDRNFGVVSNVAYFIPGGDDAIDGVRNTFTSALDEVDSAIAGFGRLVDPFNNFETRGFVTINISPSETFEVDGQLFEGSQTRWTITKLQELIQGMLTRVVLAVSAIPAPENRAEVFDRVRQQLRQLEDALSAVESRKAEVQNATADLLQQGDSLVESAPIMPFANPKLMNPAEVEKEYSPVLGNYAEFPGLSPQGSTVDFQTAEDLDGRLLQGLAGENFFKLATKIFNFDSKQARQTLYDNWVRSGDVQREINKFARRKDALTLKEFLKRTDLTLYEETARSGPFTRTYYRMASAPGADSSYFDCLLENPKVVSGTTAADIDIRQMRNTVYREKDYRFLYEKARQEIILRYSRLHFVPRALRGK